MGLAGEGWLPASAGGWLTLLLLAGVSHVLGQGLIAWAMATLPASFSALALLWQPVAAAALGALILGEGLRPGTVLGGLLVLAAIAIAYRPARRGAAEVASVEWVALPLTPSPCPDRSPCCSSSSMAGAIARKARTTPSPTRARRTGTGCSRSVRAP
ncbi:MAG: EamA family transporter [Xanthomonadales bacterium]|nr:EamA family transporter [Xanthomonadales bacterium]